MCCTIQGCFGWNSNYLQGYPKSKKFENLCSKTLFLKHWVGTHLWVADTILWVPKMFPFPNSMNQNTKLNWNELGISSEHSRSTPTELFQRRIVCWVSVRLESDGGDSAAYLRGTAPPLCRAAPCRPPPADPVWVSPRSPAPPLLQQIFI